MDIKKLLLSSFLFSFFCFCFNPGWLSKLLTFFPTLATVELKAKDLVLKSTNGLRAAGDTEESGAFSH